MSRKSKARIPKMPRSRIPSLHLLRAETEKLRNAETPEETREIKERIRRLHESVMEEAGEMREQAMRRGGKMRQQLMMRRMMPRGEVLYECPKCHRKWPKSRLNYSGRGKRKKPWCPMCNLEIFPEGDERLRHPVFPVKDKYPKNLTFLEV